MPTTSYTASTFAASVIGARTDATPAAVTDLSAEEARISQMMFAPGYLSSTAFQVAQQASPNMTVKVGSGTAKADYYVLAGTVAGQGTYIARLDTTSQNVTISAADASQTRTDEVYLVLRDNLYDSSGFALPEFGYRKGDLGGANPGADATWKAYALLARITVAPAVTSIVTANISDQRTAGGMQGLNVTATNAVNAATVNASGAVTGASVTASGAITAGTNVVGTGDVRVGSTSLPRGVISRFQRTTDTTALMSEAGVLSITGIPLVSGRLYRITAVCPAIYSTTVPNTATAAIRYTTNNTTPTTVSTQLEQASVPLTTTAVSAGVIVQGYITGGSSQTLGVLLTKQGVAQTVVMQGSAAFPTTLTVEDMGVDVGLSGNGTVL